MKTMLQAFLMCMSFTIIAGVLYPIAITGIGQMIWHEETNGSLVEKDGNVIGSELIAQEFTSQRYFWPGPSAGNFNAVPSAASNLSPTSKQLAQEIEQRRKQSTQHFGVGEHEVPAELVTTSASGLEPHISEMAARMQVNRIAEARGNSDIIKQRIADLIDAAVIEPSLGIFGEKRVNVLLLNLMLDRLSL